MSGALNRLVSGVSYDGRQTKQTISRRTNSCWGSALPRECVPRTRYSSWAERGYKWEEEDYEDPEFQIDYITFLLQRRARDICSYLTEHDPFLTEFLRSRQQEGGKPQLCITSFSCGPGTDAVALVAHFRTLLKSTDISIKVTLIDPVESWSRTAVAAVKSVLLPGDSVEFIHGCWDTPEAREAAEAADVLSFSHILVDVKHVFGTVRQAAEYINNAIKAWRQQLGPTARAVKLLLLTDRYYPDAVMGRARLPADTLRKAMRSQGTTREFLQVLPIKMASPRPALEPAGSIIEAPPTRPYNPATATDALRASTPESQMAALLRTFNRLGLEL